jgi:hypothetical protein
VTARAVGDDLLATPETTAPHPVIVQAQALTAAPVEPKPAAPVPFLSIPRPTTAMLAAPA